MEASALQPGIRPLVDATEVVSHDGLEILENVGQAPKFNDWLMQVLRPYLGERVLEAGSGIGNLTERLTDRRRVVGIDMDATYVARLRRRHADAEQFAFYSADLHDLDQVVELAEERFDSVLCVNVLEHVKDDQLVLGHFANLLAPGGTAVLLVPAHPWLYSQVDHTLGHYRRYTHSEFRTKIEKTGLKVERLFGFNRLGTLGWWASGKVLRRRTLSAGQMKTYERLLPVAKTLERLSILPALSVVAIARKAG